MLRKQFIFIFILGMFLISLSSAITEVSFIEDTQKKIEKGAELTNYGKVEIYEKAWYDIFNWFGTREKVKEIELKENTEKCSENCFAEGEIILYKDGVLVEDVLWKRDNMQTWVDWNSFVNWRILVENKNRYQEVPEYGEGKCIEKYDEKNGTKYEECEQIQIGTKIIDTGEWVSLELGKVYPAGSYRWRLEGSKKPSTILDWQIKTSGELIEEWAIWGIIGQDGATAQVNLTSPANNSILYTNFVNLSSFANITASGVYLVNATLFDNSTGSWGARGSVDLYNMSDLVSYYAFDELSGSAVYDMKGRENLTTINGVKGQSGLMNKSILRTSTAAESASTYISGGTFTKNVWIKRGPNGNYSGTIFSNVLRSGRREKVSLYFYSNNSFGWAGDSGCVTSYNQNGSAFNTTNPFGWNMFTLTCLDFSCKLYVNAILIQNYSIYLPPGYCNTHYEYLPGTYESWATVPDSFFDEYSIWNRSLSQNEVLQLYNNGKGIRFLPNLVGNYFVGQSILWNVRYCDTDGDCGFAPQNWTFSIDNIPPNITLNYPNGTINYGRIGSNLTINITATDINLDKLWYNYNGTNITIVGAVSGVWNVTNITLTTKKNITIYANDTVGNLREQTFNWDYKVLELNRSFNSTTFETKNETFTIAIEGNASVKLNFGGYEYPTIKSGNNYSTTLNMELVNNDINRTFYWIFDNSFNSGSSNITIRDFKINYTGTKQLINISIRDEYDNSLINSTTIIPNFNYYYDKGVNYNSFTESKVIDRTFGYFATPNINKVIFNGDLYYYASGYNPRYYFFNEMELNNATQTNLTLYLLLLSDGIVVRYKVLDDFYNVLKGAVISAEKKVGNNYILVEQTKADDDGEASLFLNPNAYHRITISYSGCEPSVEERRITSSDLKTIVLNCVGVVENKTNIYDLGRLEKIDAKFIAPSNLVYKNNIYEFGFNVSDDLGGIQSIDYNLKDSLGNNLLSLSSTNNRGEKLTNNVNITSVGWIYAYLKITLNNSRYISYSISYYSLDKQNYSLGNITNLYDVIKKIKDEPQILEKMGISQTTLSFLIFVISFGVIASLGAFIGIKNNESVLLVAFSLLISFFSYIGFITLPISTNNIYSKFISKYGLALLCWLLAGASLINDMRR